VKTTAITKEESAEISTLEDVKQSKKAALTIHEVATVLGLNRRTVSSATKNGEIPCVRLGRRVLIPRAAFIALLENKGKGAENV
jgi:excisionase family DNA binding protein